MLMAAPHSAPRLRQPARLIRHSTRVSPLERAEMSAMWSAETIKDPTYRAKFVDVPNVISDWLGDHGGLEGRDILDFGCGEATMALGIALRFKARRVAAVEIHKEIDNCLPYARAQLCLERLPSNLDLIRMEGDSPLERLGSFDVIYSWSVFEHVSQHLIVDCFKRLKRVLRPNGIMFLQTTPLYYSAEGSHLKPWVPAPWSHLQMQQDLLYAALSEKTTKEQFEHLRFVYKSLNRATAPGLIRAAEASGFKIVREYRTSDEIPIPDELKEIYVEDTLRTNQLVFLATHS